jgi:hypothetical protein
VPASSLPDEWSIDSVIAAWQERQACSTISWFRSVMRNG